MLITYYFVAFISKGVYSSIFIIGWTIFAFCSPILAYFTWITKEKGVFPKIYGMRQILNGGVEFLHIRFTISKSIVYSVIVRQVSQ